MRKYVLAFIAASWVGSAHAYIDPGTGLLLLQGVLAGLVSLVVFIRNPIKSIKKFLNKFIGKRDA